TQVVTWMNIQDPADLIGKPAKLQTIARGVLAFGDLAGNVASGLAAIGLTPWASGTKVGPHNGKADPVGKSPEGGDDLFDQGLSFLLRLIESGIGGFKPEEIADDGAIISLDVFSKSLVDLYSTLGQV